MTFITNSSFQQICGAMDSVLQDLNRGNVRNIRKFNTRGQLRGMGIQ